VLLAREAVGRERLPEVRDLLLADADRLEPLRADLDLLDVALLVPRELDLDFVPALLLRELLLLRLLRFALDGINSLLRISIASCDVPALATGCHDSQVQSDKV